MIAGPHDMIDRGNGPALVLLHGAGVDNHLWDPQIAHFARSRRVLAPNLPGHGNVAGADSVEEMAERVLGQLEPLGVGQFAVAGLSLGGMVALQMAARWPDRVDRLAMIESVPSVTDNPAGLWFANFMVSLMRFVSPKLIAALPASMMGAQTTEASQYLKAALTQMTPAGNHAVLQAALAYDGRPHLAGLAMPVLVMVGEKNRQTHVRAKAMADAIKGCQFVMVPGAGHLANLDAPDAINAALEAWLETGQSVAAP